MSFGTRPSMFSLALCEMASRYMMLEAGEFTLRTKERTEVLQARLDSIFEIGVFPEVHSPDLGAEFDNELSRELEFGARHALGLAYGRMFKSFVEFSHKALEVPLCILVQTLAKEMPSTWPAS